MIDPKEIGQEIYSLAQGLREKRISKRDYDQGVTKLWKEARKLNKVNEAFSHYANLSGMIAESEKIQKHINKGDKKLFLVR